MADYRAGGHVLRGDRWVVEGTHRPPSVVRRPSAREVPDTPPDDGMPAESPGAEVEAPVSPVSGHTATASTPPVAMVQAADHRAVCPDCGRDVSVNPSGSLRKHTCVIDAPLPDVTFDSEGDYDNGSP